MRIARYGSTIGLLVALLVAPTASAAAPPVTVLQIDIVFGTVTTEDFTATGGVLCASGTAVTDPVFAAGFGSKGRGVGSFHLIKTLTCDDGSGTFQILVDASTAPSSPGTLGGFSVVGGTGDYAGLRGAGSLVGTNTGNGIIDVYTGRLTIVG
jgi:hypothetical protein